MSYNPPIGLPVSRNPYAPKQITGMIVDEWRDLECQGCGSWQFSGAGVCLYCKRPNPFAEARQAARQAAKSIEVTQLDDYVPRYVFDGTMTQEEAREFALLWAKHQSMPQAWIPSPPAFDGAYALPSVEPYRPKQPSRPTPKPSLLSRLISRLFP